MPPLPISDISDCTAALGGGIAAYDQDGRAASHSMSPITISSVTFENCRAGPVEPHDTLPAGKFYHGGAVHIWMKDTNRIRFDHVTAWDCSSADYAGALSLFSSAMITNSRFTRCSTTTVAPRMTGKM